MKKKYITIAIISTLIIGSTIGFYFLKKSQDKSLTSTPQYYKVNSVDKVFINGILVPKESKSIYIDASKGEISEVHVTNGQIIKKGESLFTYKSSAIESQIKQLNLQIETNESTRNRLNNKIGTLRKDLEIKQNELNCLLSPISKSAGAEDIIEGEDSFGGGDIQVDNGSIQSMIQQLQAEISSYNQQISALKDQVEEINLNLNSLNKQKEDLESNKTFTEIAPIDGKIVLSSDKKNLTSPYIIIESEELIVKGSISEKDYIKIKLDDDISVSIISNNETIDGKISYINDRPIDSMPIVTAQASGANSNTSYYEVKINLSSQEKLVNGFHSQGKITLDDDIIKIPKSCIVNENEKNYVFIKRDDVLEKVEVTIGEENDDKVIVEKGVNFDDIVMKNPTKDTKEGTKVE